MSRTTDLTGKRFGKLTVIQNTGEQQQRYWTWLCRCDCGNEVVVSTKRLNRGNITHCGCESRTKENVDLVPDDMTGKKYGKLTVLHTNPPTGSRRSSCLCRCDCGNECYVTAYMLYYGLRRSCGCKTDERESAAETGRESTQPRKSRSDNTSGFRGVSRHPDGRWMVSIGLKSKRYYIGLFPDFEEAVRARKRMEEILQKGFAETYENWHAQAQQDSAWAQEHPFYYDVEKSGQYFQIQTVFGSTTVSAV